MNLRNSIAGLVAAASLGTGVPTLAEFQVGLYGGYSWNHNSDVDLQQGAATDITHDSVHWDSEPWQMPPYWGVRALYRPMRESRWGLMLDYTHAKTIADRDRAVSVSGTLDGVPVAGELAPSTVYDRLEFTNGLNTMTLNAIYRFPLNSTWTPYVGAGIGVAVPHVEVRKVGGGIDKYGYEIGGMAAQFMAGIEYEISPRWSLFGEYKANWSDIDVDLGHDATLQTQIMTHQLLFGASVNF